MKHTVQEITLKNGAKGLFIHIPDATVMSTEFSFRAGDFSVDPKKWETPHLMEHLLLGATEHFPKGRVFQAEMAKNGAYNNASTGPYDINYEAECADFEWERILGLMLEAITKPLFLKEEFIAEFGNVQEELESRANNHYRHLTLAMRQQYGFVARTDQERRKMMRAVKLADVREHYQRTHTTRNMRFVIAGNLTPSRSDAIINTLEHMALPTVGSRLALPTERPVISQNPLLIPLKSVKNIYFSIDTFMTRRMTDDESDALDLVNTMLTETLYSKIFGTARERGLVYDMSSGHGETKDATIWSFGAQVSRKNAPALFTIITDELGKVFKGDIAAEDIEAAQAYALGRFQRSAQTVNGTASAYASRYFFDDGVEDYYQVPKRIKAVTKERIVAVANALFAEKLVALGLLGHIEPQMADDLLAVTTAIELP